MMLKQSASRNQRAKGFKVKHAVQICVLLLICVWLVYQLKQSYINNSAIQVTFEEVSRLGRKGLINPQLKEMEKKGDEEEQDDDKEIDRIDQEKAEEEEPEQLEDLIDEDDKEERISKGIEVMGQQV